jgi:hypothetical protein
MGCASRFPLSRKFWAPAARCARRIGFLPGDAPVWVLNADVVAEVKARPLLRAYHAKRTIAVAWVHAKRGPRTVEVRRGRITNFQSKQAGQPGTFTFCGLQLVNPKLVERGAEFLPREPVFGSIITAYQKAQAAGWAVAGVEVPGSYWADIGTPAQYLACHRELGGGGDFVAADASAVVHPKAQVSNSVVGARAVLGPRARVTNAVVAPDTRVNQPVSYLALPAPTALEPVELALLARYGWDPGCCTALPFGPRGSARTFTRVACGTRTALLVHYDPTRQENTWYVRHARFLRRLGLPVPRVLADDARGHASLFEDLGDRQRGGGVCADERGPPGVGVSGRVGGDGALARAGRGGRPAGGVAAHAGLPAHLVRLGAHLFCRAHVAQAVRLDEPVVAAILGELAGVGRALNRAPRVLVHRDLQSSNVLLKSGRPWFIDFQGMRFGPAVYDVASLLCDPYVKMDSNLRARLVEHYARRCASPALVRRLFWFGAVQRLAQALGAFARLGSQPATRAFARHIPAALGVMDEALSRGVPCPRLQRWCKDQIRVVG